MPPEKHAHDIIGWKEATALTIGRIQKIFALIDGEPIEVKVQLYHQAHEIVCAQHRTTNATEYWNTFINTLRTLTAALSDCNPKEVPF